MTPDEMDRQIDAVGHEEQDRLRRNENLASFRRQRDLDAALEQFHLVLDAYLPPSWQAHWHAQIETNRWPHGGFRVALEESGERWILTLSQRPGPAIEPADQTWTLERAGQTTRSGTGPDLLHSLHIEAYNLRHAVPPTARDAAHAASRA